MRFVFDSSCEACPRVDPPFCCTTVSIPFAIIALFDRVLSNYVRNLKQESVISVTNTTNDFLNYRLVKNNFVFYSVFFLFLFFDQRRQYLLLLNLFSLMGDGDRSPIVCSFIVKGKKRDCWKRKEQRRSTNFCNFLQIYIFFFKL